jgi:hypothetical protein
MDQCIEVCGRDVKLMRDSRALAAADFAHLANVSPALKPIAKSVSNLIDDGRSWVHVIRSVVGAIG